MFSWHWAALDQRVLFNIRHSFLQGPGGPSRGQTGEAPWKGQQPIMQILTSPGDLFLEAGVTA